MEYRPILKQADKYLSHNAPFAAEKVLLQALQDFDEPKNSDARMLFLSRLLHAYSLCDQPSLGKIQNILTEIKSVWPGADSSLRMANFRLWYLKDEQGAAPEFREAAELARVEGRLPVSFHALGDLGLTLLKLGRESEALDVLSEMEAIVPLTELRVGGETMFLQRLFEQRIALDRVARLAAALAPSAYGGWQEKLLVLSIEAVGRA